MNDKVSELEATVDTNREAIGLLAIAIEKQANVARGLLNMINRLSICVEALQSQNGRLLKILEECVK